MTKQDMIDEIAKRADITKAKAKESLEAFTGCVIDTVKKGEDVSLVGFGTFKRTDRAARKGRNPQTGAEIDIPASKAPKFTAGKAFKDAVNGK